MSKGPADVGFVPDLLSYACTHAPNHPAVVAGERRFTFAELDARARRLARLFRDWSLEAGDVVALLAKNEPEYFEIHVAAIRAGLVLLLAAGCSSLTRVAYNNATIAAAARETLEGMTPRSH